MHTETHPLSGQTVTLSNVGNNFDEVRDGVVFRIEDWWDRLTGGSWMFAVGNPAAIKYAIRSGAANLPLDDEVVYGKIGPFGHLVHVSEL